MANQMQYAICCPAANSLHRAAHALEQHGLQWLKFGNEYFCHTADPATSIDWGKVGAVDVGLNPLTRRSHPSDTGSLYLVTQEGRLFQRAYPDVPVLFDKGRHLVVSLDPRDVRKIVKHEARFSMRPAKKNEIVFETLARPAVAPRVDDRIKRIVDAISRESFAATLVKLASHPTRHSLTSHFQDAAREMRDRLQSMAYQVSFQDVRVPGGNTSNIIADKRGLAGGTRSVTLVTAHLDSVNHPAHGPDDPTAPAPGADDNGSGSGGVIEIARVLKDHSINQDLRLILFGGEEQGLFGSKHYVRQLPAAERALIRSVINMDMIAVLNTNSPTVLLEGGDPVSKDMVARLSSSAHTYTKLTVNTSFEPHDSDHVPFIEADVPAVLTIEGNDEANHNIHSANDTLNHINHDLALEILRMNTAYVADEIGVETSLTR
jgi:hypothetical protein